MTVILVGRWVNRGEATVVNPLFVRPRANLRFFPGNDGPERGGGGLGGVASMKRPVAPASPQPKLVPDCCDWVLGTGPLVSRLPRGQGPGHCHRPLIRPGGAGRCENPLFARPECEFASFPSKPGPGKRREEFRRVTSLTRRRQPPPGCRGPRGRRSFPSRIAFRELRFGYARGLRGGLRIPAALDGRARLPPVAAIGS